MNNYVFFDIDGTLHKEDIFFSYILFIIKKRKINTLVFLPFLIFFLIMCVFAPYSKKSINCGLFFIHLGLSNKQLDFLAKAFSKKFLVEYTPFENVNNILYKYIKNNDNVILITGTPSFLIELIYPNILKNNNVYLISSTIKKTRFSTVLLERCVSDNKLTLLNSRYKKNIAFLYGYSDSLSDSCILNICKKAFLIDKQGNLIPYN